jgi:ABC-type lipoprotein release transport system permease subunit
MPLGWPLSSAIGLQLFQMPLAYTFSFHGAAVWLGVMLALSTFASIAPAQRAAALSVQAALSYQ